MYAYDLSIPVAAERIRLTLCALAAACCALLLPICAPAQSKLLTEYSLTEETVVMPFTYVKHQIVVRGQIDDKRDLNLLFDTGASIPVIDSELQVSGQNFPDSIIQEAEGASKAHTLLVGSVLVGETTRNVQARNLTVLVSDLSQVSRAVGKKIDGVIGLSFMAGFVVEIDYQKRTLRFHSPRRFTIADRKPDNLNTYLFSLTDSNPKRRFSNLLITGKLVNDYDYDYILDTGFAGYISVEHSAAELSGLINRDTPRILGEGFSVSHRFRSDRIRASRLIVGDIDASNRVIQVDTRNGDAYGQHGIVGNRFFQNYSLILDAPRHKVWLERVTKTEEEDDGVKRGLGLTVSAGAGQIRVVRAAPNSPAEKAGVRAGDSILAIHGVSIGQLGIASAIALLASPDGDMDMDMRHEGSPPTPYSVTLIPQSPLDWR